MLWALYDDDSRRPMGRPSCFKIILLALHKMSKVCQQVLVSKMALLNVSYIILTALVHQIFYVYQPLEVDQILICFTRNISVKNECTNPWTPMSHHYLSDGHGNYLPTFRSNKLNSSSLNGGMILYKLRLIWRNKTVSETSNWRLIFDNSISSLTLHKQENEIVNNDVPASNLNLVVNISVVILCSFDLVYNIILSRSLLKILSSKSAPFASKCIGEQIPLN